MIWYLPSLRRSMLQKLPDTKLHSQLLKLVQKEREVLTQILSHLEEVGRR